MTSIFIVATVLVLGLLWLVIYVPLFGFHYETGRGEHTGYITAVEKGGIFFKTGTVYLKTDTQSSQEDNYCVIDPEVYAQLQKFGEKRTHVNAYHFSWFSSGIANCAGEGAIIYKVTELADVSQ